MFKLNSKSVMKATIHKATGATLCTPDGFALAARCARLKRMLKENTR